jgi:hypothetical protein
MESGLGIEGVKAVFGAGGVGLQAFAIGQGCRYPPKDLRAIPGYVDKAAALLEIIHAQR